MPSFQFTSATDTLWNTGLEASSDFASRTVHFSGNLGGGFLQIITDCEGVKTIVPNVRLAAGQTDSFGQPLTQVPFWSSGLIAIQLVGATNPDCLVAVR